MEQLEARRSGDGVFRKTSAGSTPGEGPSQDWIVPSPFTDVNRGRKATTWTPGDGRDLDLGRQPA